MVMQAYCFHAGILSTLLGLCAVFWERDLADLSPWALSVTSVIGGILVLILLSVSLQPTSSKPLPFKVKQSLCCILHHATNKDYQEGLFMYSRCAQFERWPGYHLS